MCLFVSEASKSEKKRGLPVVGTLAFSYPIRCEAIPLGALTTLAIWCL
jgi:hypothetical protein